MADPPAAFFKDQAVVYQRQVDPAAVELPCQPVVVAIGVEAEEGEPEAIFAPGCSMAASGIAAGLHEHGHDVELEADRSFRAGLFDLDGERDGLAFKFDAQPGRAILGGPEGVFFESGESRIGKGELCRRGDVRGQAVGIERLDDDGLAITFCVELDIAGIGGDLHQVCGGGGARHAETAGEYRENSEDSNTVGFHHDVIGGLFRSPLPCSF